MHTLRVLDLSAHQSGSLVAMFLADLGAQVVRLSTAPDHALAFTHRGKQRLELEPAQEQEAILALSEHVDVIIEDCPSHALRFSLTALPNSTGVIHLWMPSFAADDPLHKLNAPEGALEAACGLHETPVGLKPQYSDLSILSTTCAAYALNGVLAALIARRRDGLGQRVTLARADLAYSILELNALFTQSPPHSWATLQWAATPWISAYKASDGQYVYIHAGLRKHLERLLDALDALTPAHAKKLRDVLSAQTLQDPTSVPSAQEHKQLQQLLRELFFQHPAWFWAARLGALGLCVVCAHQPQQWLEHEHARTSLQVVEYHGELTPGLIFEVGAQAEQWAPATPTPLESLAPLLERWARLSDELAQARHQAAAPTQAPPLEGLRVLDLTQVIAGPVATRTLAELGATVLRIDNPHFNAPWVEPFHIAYNTGKSLERVDLKQPEALERFWALVDDFKPDVVVHNLRPGAAEQLGLGEDDFRAHNPKLIYVHLNAYGPRGPWSKLPGWEQTAQAAVGVQLLYGQDRPELFPLPMTDLATGLFGASAALAALLTAPKGEGAKASACLSATATLIIAAHHLAREPRQTIAHPELGRRPMHRFYKARDGWLFFSVSPSQERALLRIVGLEHIPAYSGKLRERALERAFLEATVQEWINRLLAAKAYDRVCILPRRTQRQVFKDDRARRLRLIFTREHEGLGELHECSSALALSRTPTIMLAPSPHRPGATNTQDTISWIKHQATGALSMLMSRRQKP